MPYFVGGTEAGRWWLAALLAPFYSRLKRADVLRHEIRHGIHAHVAAHPDARFEDIRRALGLSRGVLGFHLRVLEREGYVVARTEWTRRRFRAAGAPPAAAPPTPATERVLALLCEGPLGAADVAERLGISRQLARYHLLALARESRVVATGAGKSLRYRRSP